jgi:hypothetical protein
MMFAASAKLSPVFEVACAEGLLASRQLLLKANLPCRRGATNRKSTTQIEYRAVRRYFSGFVLQRCAEPLPKGRELG